MAPASRHALVGRDAVLSRIASAVTDLGPESGFALVVRADAGMGKSALLDAVAESVRDARILRAHGVMSETQIAFAGLQELLSPVLDRAEVLPERPRSALRRSLALETGETDEMASFTAVSMLLSAAADDAPVVCLVDDAHWLDESSVDALLFAARRHPRGVGFVFAAREDDAGRFEQAWLPAIRLQPLTEAECRGVLAASAPNLTDIQRDRVVCASEGCPLALHEFGAALAAGQARYDDTPLPLSTSLESGYGRLIRALPEATRRALVVLAAADTEAVGQIGQAVRAFAGDTQALDAAIDSGLVVRSAARWQFKHPLVRAAAYHCAPIGVQRAAHRALAEVLADRDPERAAWHLAAATDEPDEAVAAALVRTADVARRRGGYAAETRALERAARLTPDPMTSTHRLAEAASAALQAGKHDHAEQLLGEVLRVTDDPVVVADATHERAQIAFWHDGRRLPELTAAADKVAEIDRTRAARLLSFDLVSLISDYEVDVALPIALHARELMNGTLESSEVAFRVAHVLVMAGRTSEGAELTAQVASAALRSGNPTAAVNIAQPCIWLERYDDARTLLANATSHLRAVDAVWMLGHALVARAELERRLGDLTAARLAAAEALALAEQLAEPMQQAEALVQLAAAEADLAQPVECLAHAQRAARLAEPRECGKGELVSLGAAALGGLALASGRHGEAVAYLEPVALRVLDAGVADPAVVPWIVDLVEAYAHDGQDDRAHTLRDWLAERAQQCDRAWARRAALRCDVLLGDDAAARDRLAQALVDGSDANRLQHGRNLLVLGSSQRRAGQRAAARISLDRAHAVFAAAGARAWAERAAAELRSLGTRTVRTADRDPLDTLTPQEARVAQLVAGGARNREVAATLFVTPKTVETHLAAIYRKLGIRGRSELAVRIARAEVVDQSQGFA
ncbi:MAG TPA: AAA family ATPase [Jatrophihabitantaceae bacterium]|nr:AAA family ATPase [Jatrophihabitantaceae bacterium]